MSLKGLLFIGLFGLCAAAALVFPHVGVYGYIVDYCIHPASQWWGRPFATMGFRFSFILALATMIGMALHWKHLRFGQSALYPQEKTLFLFLGLIWFLTLISPETVGRYTTTDHPSVKFAKIAVFSLMMTHVISDLKKLNGLFWVLSSTALFLGIKAWSLPYGRFMRGRLEGIGGADFSEANFFGAFMAAMLPIIAVQFLSSKNWLLKLYALACGAFTANAVILCRSRGAFLGVAAGALAALFAAPKRHRKKIIVLLFVGLIGGAYLTDSVFIERILSISFKQEEMDTSTSSRIELWKAGARMLADNPLGIGPGNWYQTIIRYIPEYEGKDSHSTYVKCAVELGIPGILLFLLLIFQAYINLKRVHNEAQKLPPRDADDITQYYFAVTVSLVIMLACAVAITMIYIEIVWILLMLPVCLGRAFENAIADSKAAIKAEVEMKETVDLPDVP